jgi:antitoxin component of MazEF toxin-antitoxin module
MLKTITNLGNSPGLIFDTELCELTGLKAGDQVNVTVHDLGTIILTPMHKSTQSDIVDRTLRQTIEGYETTLRKLS